MLFDPECEKHIPEPLRGTKYYTLTSQESYDSLCQFLDGVAGVEPRQPGQRPPRRRRQGPEMVFGDTGTRDRALHAGGEQAGANRDLQAANPFRLSLTELDGASVPRSPALAGGKRYSSRVAIASTRCFECDGGS